jgi:hypothetical protein
MTNNEILQSERNIIFISHATPHDNDFTKWLSLKLISFGYIVWCDILFFDLGVDFWKTIEKIIRTNTCRFLVVLSEKSNESEGVLKEIAVASKVKKELLDEGFIIHLLIDEKLSFDKINIELNRLNTIDFSKSWINGFVELLQSLNNSNIPKNAEDANLSNEIFRNIFLSNRIIINKDEVYNSNWFSIISFPPYLYFHPVSPDENEFVYKQFAFPTINYKNYICTFSEIIYENNTGIDLFKDKQIIRVSTHDIINNNYESNFIINTDCKRFIVRLLNDGFKRMMEGKHFRSYYLSNKKIGFWFEKNYFDKDKVNSVLLVGEIKGKYWHFGISGLLKLFPFPILILSSHIFFTSDGKKLIPSKYSQLRLRRKQGKNWWNNTWNDKLISIVKYLASDDGVIRIPVGTNEITVVSSSSIQFQGHYSYNNPKENINEMELIEFDNDDEESGDDEDMEEGME